jgi:hypothetical protein
LFFGALIAFIKYENDDVVQSESMDNLLRLVLRSAYVFWLLVEEKAMTAELTKHMTTVPSVATHLLGKQGLS